jgi:methylisocitrate lyase
VREVAAAAQARRDLVLVARTDARATHGFDEAVARGHAYREAGADVIFPEALETAGEFRDYAAAVAGPLLANMTEFGRSPALSARELGTLGYRLVIFPVSAARVAAHHVGAFYADLLRDGSAASWLDRMQTRSDLYELIGYEGYERLDAGVARPEERTTGASDDL